LKQGFDVAIVCRGKAGELPGLTEAQEALKRIFTKAALFDPAAHTEDPPGPPPPGSPILTGWSRPRQEPERADPPHEGTGLTGNSEERDGFDTFGLT
ncbi:MAG TPA: hypothetical protein VFQ54_04930, partial [Thermomicrobiales bacterium]|nr:hypothetical protein [Thermomicrobiales bacterium]